MRAYFKITLVFAVLSWISNSVIRATVGYHEGFWMECFAWLVVVSMINLVVAFFIGFAKRL